MPPMGWTRHETLQPPLPLATILGTCTNARLAMRTVVKMGTTAAPAQAPSTSVVSPATPTIQNQASVPDSTGQKRARRNTPALTMVAEWRKADTGVSRSATKVVQTTCASPRA